MARKRERTNIRRELRRRMKEKQQKFIPNLKFISLPEYANPDFVAVVAETSKENTTKSASNAKNSLKNKKKNKENSKKS